MRQYRHDPLSRRLPITALLLLNTVVIREEYLEQGDLGWGNIACFLLSMLAVYCMGRKKQQC